MPAKYTEEQQREMIETSLRNVRDLVDQALAEEAEQKREERHVFLALGAAVVMLVLVVGYFMVRKSDGTTVIVPAAATAPRK